jgi:ATP-dependent Zn protease
VRRLGYGKRTGLLVIDEGDRSLSEAAKQASEEEIQAILHAEMLRAQALLRKNREKLDRLRDLLLAKEIVHQDDLDEVLGPRLLAVSA